MKETDIQSQLVTAAKDMGGHAFKMTNQFTVGVVDLYVKLPSGPSCLIEIKFTKIMPARHAVPDGLSVHQRKFIRDEQKALGGAGLAHAIKINNRGEYAIFVTGDLDIPRKLKFVDDNGVWVDDVVLKKHGEPWPIKEIVYRLTENVL